MIAANELRIGNLVWDDYSGEMVVTAINRSNHIELAKTFDLPSGLYTTDKIEGIPLTEEWLLKASFEETDLRPYSDQIAWIYGKDAERLILSAGRIFKPLPYDGFIKICDKCDFVHELQNFYFASKCLELTIKE